MNQKCILIQASPYSFPDEKTGEIREGISLTYIMTASLTPAKEGHLKGYKVCKESIPLNAVEQIKEVPGIYNFAHRIESVRGKPGLKVNSIEFVSACKV